MSKKFEIGEKRFVVVKKEEVRLFEDGSSKSATFTFPRWAQFAGSFDEINECVTKLVGGQQDVRLQLHVGGGWFVSVTSGFLCVDIRKFYVKPGVGVKPSKTGIALRLPEWTRLKEIANKIKEKNQKIADAQPCWTQSDHFNQQGAMMCSECNPYGQWFSSSEPSQFV
jgi:hypothetical protein